MLAVGSASSFLVYLDATIVNIAFPDVRASFTGATLAGLSWILSAYAIVFAALLVPAGRLADVVGGRRLFLAGLAAFTAGSLLCATAPSVPLLVGARVLQAAGGAMLVVSSQLLVMAAHPPEQRMKAIGLMAAVAGLASALGPVLGGLMVDLGGWRLVFLVNLPIGLAALVLGRRMPEPPRRPRAHRPDLGGSLLAVVAVGALALGAVQGPVWGWGDPRTIAAFVASALLAPLLVWRSAVHPAPVLELALFRVRSFGAGNLGSLLLGTSFFGLVLANSLYLTQVWDYSVLRAGLAIAPGPLASAAAAILAARFTDRIDPRRFVLPGARDQRDRGRLARDPGRVGAGVRRRMAAGDAADGRRRRARLRDDRRRLRARPRPGPAGHRERHERGDAPARRGVRRRDPDRDPRPGAGSGRLRLRLVGDGRAGAARGGPDRADREAPGS